MHIMHCNCAPKQNGSWNRKTSAPNTFALQTAINAFAKTQNLFKNTVSRDSTRPSKLLTWWPGSSSDATVLTFFDMAKINNYSMQRNPTNFDVAVTAANDAYIYSHARFRAMFSLRSPISFLARHVKVVYIHPWSTSLTVTYSNKARLTIQATGTQSCTTNSKTGRDCVTRHSYISRSSCTVTRYLPTKTQHIFCIVGALSTVEST